MIIVLKHHIHEGQKEDLRQFLKGHGYRVREIVGNEETVFAAVGTTSLDIRDIEVLPGVARVVPISKPYKLASRESQPEDTIVRIGPIKIGGPRVVLIAGPCAVESREQIMTAAAQIRESGAVMLRGGAFKPRTSPYSFQGLYEEGLKYLREAGDKYNLPIVSEIVSVHHVDLMKSYVDMMQIGARNMQNFELLKEVGKTGMPVLLKRGLSARIEEWLMAAEYLMAHGTDQVVLCERGIRSFETHTRNSLDLSSIPVVKNLSHLPVIVDPSHATGIRDKVMPMAMAGVAAGADGLMVEVHPDPDNARSDGAQSLFPEQFEKLVRDIETLCPVLHKALARSPLPSSPNTRKTTAGEDSTKESSQKESSSGKKIAFQGEAGAYSQMALNRYFSSHFENFNSISCPEFRDAFEMVLRGEAEYAILPLENSLTGSIHENYDLLLQYPDIRITGETRIRIQHSLIGAPNTKLADIKTVFSHPQGLAQCSRFLDTHPHITQQPYYDTAGSVAHIARENRQDYAAIAHSDTARVYNMAIIKEGIETNPNNYTRFVIVQHQEKANFASAQLASIVFSTPDKPGALLHCMETLSLQNLNLSKIESRPIHGKPWEYMFYLDVDIEKKAAAFEKALEELRDYSDDIRILGIYPRG